MKAEEIIGKAFRLWKNNPKLVILFFFGFILSISIFCAGVYIILKHTAVPLAENALHSAKSGSIPKLFNYFVKLLAETYILAIISILIAQFFFLSGICGCGKLLKEGIADISESLKCAVSKYISYIIATAIISVLSLVPSAAYIGVLFLHSKTLSTILKPLLKVISIILGFIFIYVPYAVVDGYGAIGSLIESYRRVRKDPIKTLVSVIVCVVVALAMAVLLIILIVPTAIVTILAYKNPTELIAAYSVFSLILSIGFAYGEYLISTILYATFLDIEKDEV